MEGGRERGMEEGGREEGAAAPQLFSASPPRLPHVTAGNTHGPCRPRQSSLPDAATPPTTSPPCESSLPVQVSCGLPQTVWLLKKNDCPACLLLLRAFLTSGAERGEPRFCFLLELHCEIWVLML